MGMIGTPLVGAKQRVEEVVEENPVNLHCLQLGLGSLILLPWKRSFGICPLSTNILRFFQGKSGCTLLAPHDTDVGSTRPIKSAPYKVHSRQLKEMKKELATMQAMGFSEPARSK